MEYFPESNDFAKIYRHEKYGQVLIVKHWSPYDKASPSRLSITFHHPLVDTVTTDILVDETLEGRVGLDLLFNSITEEEALRSMEEAITEMLSTFMELTKESLH